MAQQTARTRISANQCVERSRGRWNRYAHANHRDPSPTLGRFIERDPIGLEAGDNNWYRFVANGPTVSTDPSGQLQFPNPLMDELRRIYAEANRRRGHGPWGTSAHHCWAACYIGATYGVRIARPMALPHASSD
jgi:RHS repeat-associated protein